MDILLGFRLLVVWEAVLLAPVVLRELLEQIRTELRSACRTTCEGTGRVPPLAGSSSLALIDDCYVICGRAPGELDLPPGDKVS